MTKAELEAFLDAEFPQMRPMRMRIGHWDGATMRVTIPIGEQHLRPGGTVSGPVMMTLADCAGYLLILGLIGPVPLAITINLNINFLRKPRRGDLTAEAMMLNWARHWQLWRSG